MIAGVASKSFCQIPFGFDEHITGPGTVGVWTKADSVTAFDDFTFVTSRKP